MEKGAEGITPELRSWLERQKVFFVATAPLSGAGHVNCSPKGGDTFRILGAKEVAYLDLTGSGIETVAHLKENGRIVLMFCAFDGPPKIVRLHGRGEVIRPGDGRFDKLLAGFKSYPGVRSLIKVTLDRISDSCGYGVPLYEFRGERDALRKWAEKKGVNGLEDYRSSENQNSIDGLPGLFPGVKP